MTLQEHYASLLQIGNELHIWRGRRSDWGTVDKVSDKWIHIIGKHRTFDKWILRSEITSVHDATKPIILTSQMYQEVHNDQST